MAWLQLDLGRATEPDAPGIPSEGSAVSFCRVQGRRLDRLHLRGPGDTDTVDRLLGITRSDEYVAERKRAAPGETFFGDVPSVAAKARGWTSPELLDLFVEAGVACGPVLDRTECWDDPQLRQNGMIRSRPSGTEYVGNPIHWDSTLGTSNGGGGSEGKKRD